MAETPSSYKRFAQSDKISQGITNAALSLNDYLPGQHVTGPNNNDIAATLAQVQAIPIGTATLRGNTYNVTISNYPNTATIYPGQKISVKFNADAPTADDTALNLSAFGQSLPLCARGVRMGQGAIKSGMILELVYRGDMWNADYDVVKANRDANGYTTFADGSKGYSVEQVNGALENYTWKKVGRFEPCENGNVSDFTFNTSNSYDTYFILVYYPLNTYFNFIKLSFNGSFNDLNIGKIKEDYNISFTANNKNVTLKNNTGGMILADIYHR